MRHGAASPSELPVVGDWVVIRAAPGPGGSATVQSILPRRTLLSRKAAGEPTREQPLAANLDTLFLMMGLDGNFNLRRLERFVILAQESGARPVVLLSKADACDGVQSHVARAQVAAPGIPVHAVSSFTEDGLAALDPYLRRAETLVLVGSSGTGKSTLINRLLGWDHLRTGPVREADHRGQHVTTHRELVRLPGGALLMDTPGIRELALWTDGEALQGAFEDIAALACACRFGDCRHELEAGCAVREAVERRELAPERVESYRKLQKEIAFLAMRRDIGAEQAKKRKWKAIDRAARKHRPRW